MMDAALRGMLLQSGSGLRAANLPQSFPFWQNLSPAAPVLPLRKGDWGGRAARLGDFVPLLFIPLIAAAPHLKPTTLATANERQSPDWL